ncbi:PD-(D/E)XK nuclease-like domain-containing protein [Antarcticirhabdus aurantiaca]|uniref:PD-(D/E)XK nuclease-like domain-containing protein n=1 Tax=Antarcticirhabdus aurantiaca TaxID=2606717 RepID=A0ACD4NK55_9HYPH|nr:PD-(D/E)XK nuclease-like domain-containing protein [Antarcticirhabdus aurantiaca]WAJ27154.1 PD-(D/E)XK nuclease-like domain-containing protein [Jeongeuplla avenae]
MIERTWTGETITEPGIYASVPIESYHHDTGLLDGFSISSSGIRQVDDRPSAYWIHSPFNPDRVERESTEALNFGKAAHHLLLGEADFAQHFAVRPAKLNGKDWQGNRTDCKEWLEGRAAEGLTVILPAQIETLKRMRDSLAAHPIVQAGALNGRIERSMFARFGKVWLRARPDVIPMDGGDFVDLKTAAAVDDDSLSRAIFSAGYHVQAAVVRMVWCALGLDFGSFVLAFLEKTPPYEVRFFEIRTSDIDLGERQARAALRTVEECLKRGQWPGYDGWDPSVLNIDIPTWARTRAEATLAVKEAA